MTIYISGPITGRIDGNRVAFEVAESAIRHRGHDAVNPQTLPHNHYKTWEEYMREDIKAMLDCDAVYALPEWELSRGAKIEIGLARELGMVIYSDVKAIP